MRANQKVLESLINKNLYEFLRSHSVEQLKNIANDLRLSQEQCNLLDELQPIAINRPEHEFLETLTLKFPNSYPIKFDLEQSCDAPVENYFSLLKDKKVVLVGPSCSIISSGNGSYIDSFDLVVRMNSQWPIPKNLVQDLGQRIDILYHCCNGDVALSDILNQDFNAIKFVCYENNIDSRPLRRYCKSNNIDCMDITNIYRELSGNLNTAVNTGTVAISHLLQFQIANLYITGISFFQEPYYSGYQADGAAIKNWESTKKLEQIHQHKFAPQIQYCRDLILKDSRVSVDQKLATVLGIKN